MEHLGQRVICGVSVTYLHSRRGANAWHSGPVKPRVGFGMRVIAALGAVSVPSAYAGVVLPGDSGKAVVR